MAALKNRPPCPNCGSGLQDGQGAGWANEETIPVKTVRCQDCNFHGEQITVWLPVGVTSLNRLDADRRLYQKMRQRRVRSQLPQVRKLIQRHNSRITSDTLLVTIEVIPGRLQRGLKKRYASLIRKKVVPIAGVDEVAI